MDQDTIREAPADGGPGDADSPDAIPWDPNEYSAIECRSCGRPRVFRRRRVNHSLHFMLSLGTLGVWLPAWGVVIVVHSFKPWACIVCRAEQRQS